MFTPGGNWHKAENESLKAVLVPYERSLRRVTDSSLKNRGWPSEVRWPPSETRRVQMSRLVKQDSWEDTSKEWSFSWSHRAFLPITIKDLTVSEYLPPTLWVCGCFFLSAVISGWFFFLFFGGVWNLTELSNEFKLHSNYFCTHNCFSTNLYIFIVFHPVWRSLL